MTPTHDRDEMRKFFFEAWRKHKENQLVEPLESQIIEIILLHPEYHALFDHPENVTDTSESNPFLHVSLHLAVREQISTDRPQGIRTIYNKLCQKFHDSHMAEHQLLDCLGHILWDANRTNSLVDEKVYLEKLRQL